MATASHGRYIPLGDALGEALIGSHRVTAAPSEAHMEWDQQLSRAQGLLSQEKGKEMLISEPQGPAMRLPS